jgi:hypothetical protein
VSSRPEIEERRTSRRDPSRLVRLLTAASFGLLAVFVFAIVFLGALAALLLVVFGLVFGSSGPDEGKAREEVQRWYDARGGGVQVERCEAGGGDSVHRVFSCVVERRCERRVVFDVPRAADIAGTSDPRPVENGARFSCP